MLTIYFKYFGELYKVHILYRSHESVIFFFKVKRVYTLNFPHLTYYTFPLSPYKHFTWLMGFFFLYDSMYWTHNSVCNVSWSEPKLLKRATCTNSSYYMINDYYNYNNMSKQSNCIFKVDCLFIVLITFYKCMKIHKNSIKIFITSSLILLIS